MLFLAYLPLGIQLVLFSSGGFVLLALYRLYFHPLAKVPGPRLAAISRLYDFYFDCLLNGGGKFAFQIEQLHKQYGLF
jgi:hypothetical protein